MALAGAYLMKLTAACGAHSTGTRGSTGGTGKTGAVTGTRPTGSQIPGDSHRTGPTGRLFSAIRQAAEDRLDHAERQRAGQAAPEPSSIKKLRRGIADVHPDGRGTTKQLCRSACRSSGRIASSNHFSPKSSTWPRPTDSARADLTEYCGGPPCSHRRPSSATVSAVIARSRLNSHEGCVDTIHARCRRPPHAG